MGGRGSICHPPAVNASPCAYGAMSETWRFAQGACNCGPHPLSRRGKGRFGPHTERTALSSIPNPARAVRILSHTRKRHSADTVRPMRTWGCFISRSRPKPLHGSGPPIGPTKGAALVSRAFLNTHRGSCDASPCGWGRPSTTLIYTYNRSMLAKTALH